MQPGPLVWLQGWYASQCDAEWEHEFGVTIETLDNPGWSLRVELLGTKYESQPFERVEHQRAEHDWCVAWVDNSVFEAACGPLNLGEAIHLFRLWCQQ